MNAVSDDPRTSSRAAELVAAGERVGVYKPVATGGLADAEALHPVAHRGRGGHQIVDDPIRAEGERGGRHELQRRIAAHQVDEALPAQLEQSLAQVVAGVRLVDISADFRLKDVSEWERWYGLKHAAPELVAQAVYGLPEVQRARIRNARLVANPGCYPTSIILGLAPALRSRWIDASSVIADSKSGVSGAGREPPAWRSRWLPSSS